MQSMQGRIPAPIAARSLCQSSYPPRAERHLPGFRRLPVEALRIRRRDRNEKLGIVRERQKRLTALRYLMQCGAVLADILKLVGRMFFRRHVGQPAGHVIRAAVERNLAGMSWFDLGWHAFGSFEIDDDAMVAPGKIVEPNDRIGKVVGVPGDKALYAIRHAVRAKFVKRALDHGGNVFAVVLAPHVTGQGHALIVLMQSHVGASDIVKVWVQKPVRYASFYRRAAMRWSSDRLTLPQNALQHEHGRRGTE